MTDAIIRPLSIIDVDRMIELQEIVLSEKDVFFTKSSRTLYENSFTYSDNFALGAFVEDDLVGFCTCSIPKESIKNLGRELDEPVDLSSIGHLNSIIVSPQYRGCNYALMLQEKAISTFREKYSNIRILLLTIWPENHISTRLVLKSHFNYVKLINRDGQKKQLYKLEI